MAQFDVFRLDHGQYVLDCQSDLLNSYNSRLVVPLVPPGGGLPAMTRLNPVFDVAGQRLMMMTEFATAVSVRELRDAIGGLASHDLAIKGAFDYLINGC